MFHNEISGIILNHVKSDIIEYSNQRYINNYANFVDRLRLILQYRVPW